MIQHQINRTTDCRMVRYLIMGILAISLSAVSAVAAQESGSEKSPKKAFMMSILVPGLGEFYSGAKYRAAGFFGAEALTWLAWSGWRSKGADLRAEFRQFADQNWDEARYREWQAFNAAPLGSNNAYIETETLPTKEEDTQQYYELIGKYAQFIYGWSDVANLPLSIDNQSITSAVEEQYETMRNESNKHLKRASVIIGLTVVNHIASAIHAFAYTRSLSSSESRCVWVNFSPITPDGREGVSATLRASF